MKISLLLLSLLMLASVPAAAAEVYKWKDSEGRTRYTDIPPSSNIPYVTLSGKKSPAPAAAADAAALSEPSGEGGEKPAPAAVKPPASSVTGKTLADKELEDAKKKLAAEEERKKKDEMEAEQKQREKNCSAAKSNLIQLQQGGRIYSTNEKGEREYLADTDREKNIAQAEKDVEEWCKPK